MKTRDIVTLTVFTAIFTSPASADTGVSGWTIFRKVQSSRPAVISAAAPSYGDVSGVFYNPAAGTLVEGKEVFLLSEMGGDEDKLGGIFLNLPVGKGWLTLGGAYYDAGPVELNWMDGGVLNTRTVSAQQDVFGIASYAVPLLSNFCAGLSLKGASSEIAEMKRADAFAVDLGFLYFPLQDLAFSISIQNAGNSSKFIEKENPLPFSGYFGAGWFIGSRKSYVLPAAGVTYNVVDETTIPEAGIELGTDLVALNAGYRFSEGEMNMNFGLRLRVNSTTFGYSFVPGTCLDAAHRLNMSYRFGE